MLKILNFVKRQDKYKSYGVLNISWFQEIWNGKDMERLEQSKQIQGHSAVTQELRPFGSKFLQMEKNQTDPSAIPSTVNAGARKGAAKTENRWPYVVLTAV